MKENPIISVVIPIYKTPEIYLRSCIESAQNQVIQNIEIILVDDGSPDECGKICDEYAQKDNRITVIHQKNSGVSVARNAGIQKAIGHYLTFIDADDMILPNAWEKAIAIFEQYACDCVVFGWNDFTADGKYPHAVTTEIQSIPAKEAMFQIASDNFKCGGGYPWNKIWNREKIVDRHSKVPLFDTEIYTYEDKLWIIETLKNLDSLVLIPDVLYDYRFVPTSLTQSETAWKKRQFNAYDAYDKILNTLCTFDQHAYEGALKFYFYFCFTDLKILYPNRKNEIQRFKDTKRRLFQLSKRIRLGELHKSKYIAAWIAVLIVGWI